MHVLYASDENYVRHAAASMVSLMENNRDAADITIHFLTLGITEESAARLTKLVEGYGRALALHEMGDIRDWFDYPIDPRGFSFAALARLFVARFLPEEVSRVIYLDCDTVVRASLTPLWETDLSGSPIGMVMEPTVNKARRVSLGMPDEVPYYNSGVLLIDLDRWRAENTEKTVIDYYGARGGNLLAPDQDALNGALCGRIHQLPPRYNYGSVQIYYGWKAQQRIAAPTPFLTQAEYTAQTAEPAIVHFLGEERPWRAGCRHPFVADYDRYLSLTPWAGTPKDEGWRTYFRCFYLFNAIMKPFPVLRWRIIDGLIPLFMRHRARQREKKEQLEKKGN